MTDSHARSVAKAVSWRALGTLDTFAISWLVTGLLHHRPGHQLQNTSMVGKRGSPLMQSHRKTAKPGSPVQSE